MSLLELVIVGSVAGAVFYFAVGWLGRRRIGAADLGHHVRQFKVGYLCLAAALAALGAIVGAMF